MERAYQPWATEARQAPPPPEKRQPLARHPDQQGLVQHLCGPGVDRVCEWFDRHGEDFRRVIPGRLLDRIAADLNMHPRQVERHINALRDQPRTASAAPTPDPSQIAPATAADVPTPAAPDPSQMTPAEQITPTEAAEPHIENEERTEMSNGTKRVKPEGLSDRQSQVWDAFEKRGLPVDVKTKWAVVEEIAKEIGTYATTVTQCQLRICQKLGIRLILPEESNGKHAPAPAEDTAAILEEARFTLGALLEGEPDVDTARPWLTVAQVLGKLRRDLEKAEQRLTRLEEVETELSEVQEAADFERRAHESSAERARGLELELEQLRQGNEHLNAELDELQDQHAELQERYQRVLVSREELLAPGEPSLSDDERDRALEVVRKLSEWEVPVARRVSILERARIVAEVAGR